MQRIRRVLWGPLFAFFMSIAMPCLGDLALAPAPGGSQPTEKLRCQDIKAEPGGGGINVSRAIRKLGGESHALYLAGGINGEVYSGLLDTELRGHHTKVEIEGHTRESFTCYDEMTGKEFRFNMPGPVVSPEETAQTIVELEKLLDPPPAYLVLSGSLPQGIPATYFADIAKMAKKKGIKVIIDTSGPQLLAAAQNSDHDMLVVLFRAPVSFSRFSLTNSKSPFNSFLAKPNKEEMEAMLALKDTKLSYLKDELEAITHEFEDDEQLIGLAQLVIKRGRCDVIVVSLGKAGAVLVTADHVELMRGLTVGYWNLWVA